MNETAMPGAAGARTASILNIIAGIWLIVSPFVLTYTTLPVAMWDTIIVGIIVLILAWARAASPMRNIGLSWLNLLLGIWLIVSPFVLGYSPSPAAMWNNVVLGAVVVILSIWSATATPETPQLVRR